MLRRQSHAQRAGSGSTARRFGPALGWGVALIGLVGLALIVGRPSTDRGAAGGSPTPIPTSVSVISFGSALDEATRQITVAQEAFQATDSFAWSAELPDPSVTGEVLVQVLRIEPSGEVEVQAPSAQEVTPGSRLLGVALPAGRLFDAWGAGDYRMRIYAVADGPVVAEGRFSLVADGP
jgi:hypothetical protein